eukprot:CFRG2610T1
MGKNEVHQVLVAQPIYCFSFNKDRTEVAVATNSRKIQVFKLDGKTWTKTHVLAEHGQTVTSIDWAPETNRIVTCGQDRNAYVWVLTDGEWKPTLVLLRVNRACTYVKWSPKEDKFAVCTGARMVSICNFEEENDWWVSRHIKEGIRSTTTCVDWHPNNIVIAVGSSDFKVRIYSSAVKGVDKKPADCQWGPGSELRKFGTLLHEFASPRSGWVNSVAFSASGDKVAWVAQSSFIASVNGNDSTKITSTRIAALPHTRITFLTEDTVVCAGNDPSPTVYTDKNGSWEMISKLDEAKKVLAKDNSAMSKFRLMDAKGSDSAAGLLTVHQGAVTHMAPFAGEPGSLTRIVTAGKDGKVVIWDL